MRKEPWWIRRRLQKRERRTWSEAISFPDFNKPASSWAASFQKQNWKSTLAGGDVFWDSAAYKREMTKVYAQLLTKTPFSDKCYSIKHTKTSLCVCVCMCTKFFSSSISKLSIQKPIISNSSHIDGTADWFQLSSFSILFSDFRLLPFGRWASNLHCSD